MKIYSFIIIIAASMFTACGSAAEPKNTAISSSNSSNAAGDPINSANVAPPSAPPASSGNFKASATSPMETMKTLNAATKAKDVAAMKQLVSKGTLLEMEKSAQLQNMTVDEMLLVDDGESFEEVPEMRSEKITGERATVEIKNTLSGEWTTLPFVKEDGVWRVAMDEYLLDMQKKATEDMNKPATESGGVTADKPKTQKK